MGVSAASAHAVSDTLRRRSFCPGLADRNMSAVLRELRDKCRQAQARRGPVANGRLAAKNPRAGQQSAPRRRKWRQARPSLKRSGVIQSAHRICLPARAQRPR
jgi:hypothetical protein